MAKYVVKLIVFAVIVLAIVIFVASILTKVNRKRTFEELSAEIKTLKILETATIRQDVELYLDTTEIKEISFLGITYPKTAKIGYVARGYVKAGFKFDDDARVLVRVEFSDDGQGLRVTLPRAQVLDVKLDPNTSELVFAQGDLLGPDKLEMFMKMQPAAEKRILVKTLKEGKILVKAEKFAEDHVRRLADGFGFEPEQVEVRFVKKLPDPLEIIDDLKLE